MMNRFPSKNIVSDIGAFALFAVTCWLIYKCFLQPKYLSHYRLLPGPAPDSWLRGNLPRIFKAGPGEIHLEYAKQYGGFLRYQGFLGESRLMVTDPKARNHILVLHSYDYPKPMQTRGQLSKILGKGILFAEGDDHRRQKKIMSPAFNNASVNHLTPIFLQYSEALRDILIKELEDAPSKELDISQWLSRLTLDIIGKAGFDYDFDALHNADTPLAQSFNKLFKTPFNATFFVQIIFLLVTLFPVFSKLPTKRTRELKQSLAVMEAEGDKIIQQKVAELAGEKPSQSRDLISLLIRANMSSDNEKSQMSDTELRGQLTTFMLAGHETTANASAWCLYYLSKYKDIQDRLRAEIIEARTKLKGQDFDAHSLENLPFLDAVVKESLRLQTPVPSTIREAAKDDFIPLATPITLKDGTQTSSVFVKAKTPIFLSMSTVNLNESIWGEDASQYRPDRWLGEMRTEIIEQTKGSSTYAHLSTFLAGPRACIGYKFSVSELKSIIATLVERIVFEPSDEGFEITPRSTLVVRPFIKGREKEGSQLPLKMSLAI